MSVAAKRGMSFVANQAAEERVVLVNHGRPVAVVDSAERLDADVRLIRSVALTILDRAADKVADRTEVFDLSAVCARLGFDVEQVRQRAAEEGSRASTQ